MTASKDPGPRNGESHEDELYSLLSKKAASTTLETNEGVSGTNQVYPDPPGREEGTMDATWGEKGVPGQQNSSAVEQTSGETRQGVLNRQFSGFGSAASEAKKTVGQNFATKSYESRSAMLEKSAHPRGLSLLERVKNLIGRA